MYITKENRI